VQGRSMSFCMVDSSYGLSNAVSSDEENELVRGSVA
jgi:hypothetical protein